MVRILMRTLPCCGTAIRSKEYVVIIYLQLRNAVKLDVLTLNIVDFAKR